VWPARRLRAACAACAPRAPQDGSIQFEVKLTGELSTNLVSQGEDARSPAHGTLVLPGVNAQHHQHMFCARLDLAVGDARGGRGLVVSEVRG
jgi:primary-amine oxidase